MADNKKSKATQKKDKESITVKNKIISLENILCLFVVLCPFLDVASFIFRNKFNTTVSISTFVRPIIPVIICFILFFMVKGKEKLKLLAIFVIYLTFGLIHLYVASKQFTGWSYGTVKVEFQYVLNFTFLIVYLCMFMIVFKNIDTDKLKKSLIVMLSFYMASIYAAIITKTSSYTYPETSMGYKGWIESGNSLSAILTLSLFVVLDEIKSKNIKWRIYSIVTLLAVIAFLILFIGTRTGLLGSALAIAIFIGVEVIFSKNKKLIIAGIVLFLIGITGVGVLGSKTLERRKEVEEMSYEIFDNVTGEPGVLTGDLLVIKNQILDGTIEEGYMSEVQKNALMRTYNYCKDHNVKGTDSRKQELVYNFYLVLEQKNIVTILVGNGFEANYRELIMENELASFVFNFGIIGFILYAGAFIGMLLYSVVIAIKNIKKIKGKYIMYQCGLALTIVLSWMSGYIFFATSNMCVITIITLLLFKEILKIKEDSKVTKIIPNL